MKKHLWTIVFLSIPFLLLSQSSPYWSRVYDLFSNKRAHYPSGLSLHGNKIYLRSEGTCSPTNNTGCSQLSYFTLNGDLVWSRLDSTIGTSQDDNLLYSDSSYVVGGDYPYHPGEKDFALDRYDLDSTEIDRFVFYDTCVKDLSRSLKMSDDAFFLDAYCEKETDSTKHGFVYRIAKDLSRLERKYKLTHGYPAFSDMAVFPDGKMAVTYTNPYIGQTSSYVDCFDTTGQILWTFTHPYVQTNGRKWCSITPTRDGGFFVTWALDTFFYIDPPGYWTGGYYTFVYKLDGDGKLLWTKTVLGGYTAWTKTILNAFETENGDLLCVGSNENLRYMDEPQIFPIRLSLGYAIRLSSEGELLWERTYLDTLQGKPISTSELSNAVELPDKGFVFAGQFIEEWTPATANNFTGQDIWLLRVDSTGCLQPNCTDTLQITLNTPELPTPQRQVVQFDLWPNPGEHTIYLTSRLDSKLRSQPLLLTVFDINGKTIKQQQFESQIGAQVDMTQAANGAYFITARQANGNLVFEGKWIKTGGQ